METKAQILVGIDQWLTKMYGIYYKYKVNTSYVQTRECIHDTTYNALFKKLTNCPNFKVMKKEVQY